MVTLCSRAHGRVGQGELGGEQVTQAAGRQVHGAGQVCEPDRTGSRSSACRSAGWYGPGTGAVQPRTSAAGFRCSPAAPSAAAPTFSGSRTWAAATQPSTRSWSPPTSLIVRCLVATLTGSRWSMVAMASGVACRAWRVRVGMIAARTGRRVPYPSLGSTWPVATSRICTAAWACGPVRPAAPVKAGRPDSKVVVPRHPRVAGTAVVVTARPPVLAGERRARWRDDGAWGATASHG